MHKGGKDDSGADVGDACNTKNFQTVSLHDEQIIDHGSVSSAASLEKCVAQQVDQDLSTSAPDEAATPLPPSTLLVPAKATVENKRKRIEIDSSEVVDDGDAVAEFQPNRRKVRRNAISPNGATAEIVRDVCLLFHMDNVSIVRPPSPTVLTAECSESKNTFDAEGLESSDAESINAKSPSKTSFK